MSGALLRSNIEKHRYELIDQGEVVGFVDYDVAGDEVILKHTEVVAEHEGKGYGSVLAKQTLSDVLAQNRKALVRCEFIAGYMRRHPEYAAVARTSLD